MTATRRDFFRLDVVDRSVWFAVGRIGQQDVPPAQVHGRLADVSGGGIRMASEHTADLRAWRVRSGVTGRVHFALLAKEPPFDLPARLVRLTETRGGLQLAFAWEAPPPAEVDRLVHALYQLEVRRRAATPDGRLPAKRGATAPVSPAKPRARRPGLLGAALGLAGAGMLQWAVGGPAMAITAALAVLLAIAYLLAPA